MKNLLTILVLGMFLMSSVAYAGEHGGTAMKAKKKAKGPKQFPAGWPGFRFLHLEVPLWAQQTFSPTNRRQLQFRQELGPQLK